MPEKTIGYSLLVSGLVVVLFAAFSVYQVFTGRAKPVALFSFPAIEISLDSLVSEDNKDSVSQLTGSTELPKTELIPASVINDSTNIFAHVVLMGFLASIGSRIATVGTNLLRPIIIKAPGLKQHAIDETKKA